MIVVDTNVLAYLLLPGDRTGNARSLYERDPQWCAPLLWRSELRSVLALYIRKKAIEADGAVEVFYHAEQILHSREYRISTADVLELVTSSPCSAYDCEYVALARELRSSLVTSDKGILKAFPDIAVPLRNF